MGKAEFYKNLCTPGIAACIASDDVLPESSGKRVDFELRPDGDHLFIVGKEFEYHFLDTKKISTPECEDLFRSLAAGYMKYWAYRLAHNHAIEA